MHRIVQPDKQAMPLKTPILFLVFNRPAITRSTFEAIRLARPKVLFIAGDGPRSERPGEAELCEETRSIVEEVDWDCQLKTLFQPQNLGCEIAVSTAISWFFEHVEEGIILEDDCLPDPSFFPYCTELLDRYRTVEEVKMIGGNNFLGGVRITTDDYVFSKYATIWGWATWRRAWQEFSMDVDTPEVREEILKRYSSTSTERSFWEKSLRELQDGMGNTWDYRWLYSIWKHDGLAVMPRVNLVENIGFGEEATHTKSGSSPKSEPLLLRRHPNVVRWSKTADRVHFRNCYPYCFQFSNWQKCRFWLGRMRRKLLNGYTRDSDLEAEA